MSRAFVGIILAAILIGTLTLTYQIRPVKAVEEIYIRSDGSIYPPTVPITTTDRITYVLTANIYSALVVERNGIIINGAGYAIEGNGTGNGITLSGRSGITIKNTVVRNFEQGIYLNSSFGNTLSGNSLTNNGDGIGINYFSDSNFLSGNDVRNNGHGIWLSLSSNNILFRNKVANNTYGIELWFSANNTLSYNNITANTYVGIHIWDSSNNNIFRNNFVNNAKQVYTTDSNNKWVKGYPAGGNYWNNHTGTDSKSGPNQDQPGSDGIIDTPYIIDTNNKDTYPLKNPISYVPSPDLNNDGIINIIDLTAVAKAYGSYAGHPRWNPEADLNDDGKVDIIDLTKVAKEYGKKWPPP